MGECRLQDGRIHLAYNHGMFLFQFGGQFPRQVAEAKPQQDGSILGLHLLLVGRALGAADRVFHVMQEDPLSGGQRHTGR